LDISSYTSESLVGFQIGFVLASIPANQHRWLQSVMNAAAKLIHRRQRYDHVTPLLRDLHW